MNRYLFKYFLLYWVIIFLGGCTNSSPKKQPQIAVPEVDAGMFTNMDSLVIAKKAEELDGKFKYLQRKTGFNGTVLYAEKGRIVFEKAYGYRDVRHRKDSMKINDAFQLASVSKMFTATAVMILHNQGKLDYDADIRNYLPGFPYEDVTCRWLMNQRSGLPRYMSLALDKWPNKKVPLNNDDMLNLFIKYHPDRYFAPNSGFHYCNTNYALLANIVEAISGMPFDEFMKKNVFEPLGMNDSFVYNMHGDSVVPLYVDKGVPGFYHRGWRWRRMENDYLNGVMGDKNVYSSVEDIYKFDRSLDNFTLLPDSILRDAFKPGSKTYWRRKNNYGFGWRIKDGMDSTVFHFGWWKGFRTFYIRDMKHQKTLIVLTNKDKGPGSANFWNIIKSDTLPIGQYTAIDSQKVEGKLN